MSNIIERGTYQSGLSTTRWFDGVDAASLERLAEIAKKVDEVVDETIDRVKNAQLAIGKLLIEARALIPGDQQFGQWRKESLPQIGNAQTVRDLMAAAEFADSGRLQRKEAKEKMSLSLMVELSRAPQSVVTKVESVLGAGENVTVQEVRGMKREAAALPSPAATPTITSNALANKERLDRFYEQTIQYITGCADHKERYEKIMAHFEADVTPRVRIDLAYAFFGLATPEGDAAHGRWTLQIIIQHVLSACEIKNGGFKELYDFGVECMRAIEIDAGIR